ncbi:PREDICTED: Ca(2+)/calmodulin-responsive adenylate cyclase-like isoform X3 [Rhagoletis zephyria]|uniref:Ca(2+)/calmodulin-responsive adenylate cyclase-like isoform X3 n=1 Tax=Rhagoletis zephyria TaxID=28612 RepID=UPI0008116D5C|nr:PREDICTED: Ca(2+)/calmodulin-responsive adenylate cyclase-like isoform X3 [Rhagoletis zephyria]
MSFALIKFILFFILYFVAYLHSSSIPLHLISLARIIIFMIAILVHGRLVEWTARLDFLWQLQASQEKKEMDVLQESNKRILHNLLPAHVAAHFLDNQFRSNMELYHQSYAKVGVIFASVPNFHEFYTEMDGSDQGLECLRLLNEIIADFDELLKEDRFHGIDKIKTVGSTYMAVVGLIPEYRINANDPNSVRRHMTALVEYVKAMRLSLQEINSHSYNNFMLRVGINIGPVVAGVIGARKPQYDIWGNTVNVASRMDSTGIPGYTQVTQEVVDSLQGSHFEFRCRGTIKVKGKGDMVTYFLCDSSNNGLNGEVRNAMIANRAITQNGNGYASQQQQQQQQQTQSNGLHAHAAEYYQKQSQLQDNSYQLNMNSETYNIKKDNYGYNNMDTSQMLLKTSPNAVQEEQQQLLLHQQQAMPQQYQHHLAQQQQQRLNSKLQKQPNFIANGGLPNIRENGHNGEHNGSNGGSNGVGGYAYNGYHPAQQQTQQQYNNGGYVHHQRSHSSSSMGGGGGGIGVMGVITMAASSSPALPTQQQQQIPVPVPVPAQATPSMIMPMQQQHPQAYPPKYEPPRYTCPNTIMLQQQHQQHLQQQLQLQHHHHQQQQLHQQYPLYSQHPQPPLPVPPPKPTNLNASSLATASVSASASASLKQNTPLLRTTYMKPLPKLPTEIEESREMSSTDDLSSRPHSPSMSSSDESYSKTTEGEGDEDSPRITAKGQHNHHQRNGANPLQWLYPCDIQVDPTSPVVDMSNLKDFEVSSTTESQGQQTNTTHNKGDSCNSFEYQDRVLLAVGKKQASNGGSGSNGGGGNGGGSTSASNSAKSPFERELQRLLNESSRARALAAATSSPGGNITSVSNSNTNPEGNTTSNSSSRNNIELSYSASNSKLSSNNGLAAGGSGSNGNLSGSNSMSGNNNQKSLTTTMLDDLTSPTTGRQPSKIPISTSFMIAKHPVGLEAIKEITRNKNPSESSQMQTSDTESCEILHENCNQLNLNILDAVNNQSSTSTGTNYRETNHMQPQAKDHNHRHRQRPRSKDLDQSRESLDQLADVGEQQQPQRHVRHHHHHHHHHHQRPRANHTAALNNDTELDDTEDNLADEEFEDDEVGRDVRKKRLVTILTDEQHVNKISSGGLSSYEDEEDEHEVNAYNHKNDDNADYGDDDDEDRHVEMNVINDELKYGAGHHNHQSMDSNPLESQSEWSDDDCREEATGGAESTGYITDEPGLENISLLNEAGLTDAEGALSDVNSLYNAPDVDDTSVSSRASSRLLSLDSLSGLYDCDLDSKHEMAIVNVSHKITNKFGPQQQS